MKEFATANDLVPVCISAVIKNWSKDGAGDTEALVLYTSFLPKSHTSDEYLKSNELKNRALLEIGKTQFDSEKLETPFYIVESEICVNIKFVSSLGEHQVNRMDDEIKYLDQHRSDMGRVELETEIEVVNIKMISEVELVLMESLFVSKVDIDMGQKFAVLDN